MPSLGSVSRLLRAYFVAMLVLSLVVGLLLYTAPDFSAVFWPYRMKALATRMFASMFLAVAVASALALREREWDSVKIVLVQGVPSFGLILTAALINYPRLELGKEGAIAWLILLSSVTVVGLFFLLERGLKVRGEAPRVAEQTTMSRGLRFSLLAHTVIVVPFGLQMLIVPEVASRFWPWTLPPIIMQGIGGLFLGVTVGTGWGYTQKYWERVKVVLPAYSTFSSLVLLAVVIHWDVIARESPGLEVTAIWLLLYLYTAAYPLYFYLRQSFSRRPRQPSAQSPSSGCG